MASGGEIVLEMRLDDKDVPIKIKNLGTLLRQFQATANQTATSVKKLEVNAESLSTRFRHLVMTMGNLRFVAMDLHDVFLRLPAAILKSAGELEKTTALLGGLSTEITKAGKAAEAASNFEYITQMAQKAPFAISALSDAFVKLKSAGMDPTAGSLQALVDGVAKFGGTSETMHRASIAIQQMMGKGVISMEELRQQLGEAIPTAMRNMAEGMGMSMAQLTNAVSKGTVEASSALNKMLQVMRLRNEGAAEEMMKTWNGTLAQLKTRAELAAKEISEAGFGQAMKDVVAEMSNSLNGIDMRRFNDAFGSGLGDAVRAIASFVRLLVDYAEAIKVLAMGWAAYKVSTSFITPAFMSIKASVMDGIGAIQKQITATNSLADTQRRHAASAAQTAAIQSRAEMVESARRISILQAELTQKKMLQAQYQAQMPAAKTAVMSASTLPDIAAAQAHMRALKALDAQNSAAMRNIRTEIDKSTASHGQAAAAVMGHGNAIDALGRNAKGASGALGAMKVAGGAVGTVLSALGGWTLALNIAIMAGMYLWANWGKAAEEAMNRASRARRGLSDEEDLKKMVDDQTALVKKRELLQRKITDDQRKYPNIERNPIMQKEHEEDKARLKAMDGEMMRFTELLGTARRAVEKNRSREEVQFRLDQAADEHKAIRQASVTKLTAIDKAFDDEMTLAGKNLVKQQEAQTKKEKALHNLNVQELTAMIKADQVALAAQREQMKGNDPNRNTAIDTADALTERIRQNQDKLKSALLALNPNVINVKGETDKHPVVLKIKEFTENLAEAEKGLRSRIDSLLQAEGKIDTVDAAMKEFDERVKSGDFNTKGPKGVIYRASDDDLADARAKLRKVRSLEELEAAMKTVADSVNGMRPDHKKAMEFLANPLSIVEDKVGNRFSEMVAKLSRTPAELEAIGRMYGYSAEQLNGAMLKISEGEKIAATIDFANSYKSAFDSIIKMRPDFEEAVLTLANPLRASNNGRANQFDEMLTKLRRTPEELEEVSRVMGIPIEKIQAFVAKLQEGKTMAGTIDAAAAAKSIVEENRAMSLAILTDDRERLRQQIQMENEATNVRHAGILKAATDARMEGAEMMALQDAIAKSAVLRSAKMAQDLKSPLDKMVDEWKNSMDKMEEVGVRFSEGFIDGMVKMAQTGKFEFGSLVQSMLADMLKLELKAQFSPVLRKLFKMGLEAVFGPTIKPGSDLAPTPGPSGTAFADGGIMTAMGSMPLRKYAAGGIANSPQMAMFGEGSMNEAYVPLPDGRRIPVAMEGGAGNVTVNVINQSGTQMNAKQGQQRFDGKQMILDVVLTAANQPGQFRDGMKGALT